MKLEEPDHCFGTSKPEALALEPQIEHHLVTHEMKNGRRSVEVRDAKGSKVERPVLKSFASAFLVDKGNYRHFMAKEIHEQPEVVGHMLAHYLDMAAERVRLPVDLPFDFRSLERVSMSACGTAYYAGLVAKYWFERFARRAELRAVAFQLVAQLAEILDDAVVHDRQAVGGMRVRVVLGRRGQAAQSRNEARSCCSPAPSASVTPLCV